MKYLTQFIVIFLFVLLGEILSRVLPFTIPAAVYGLVLLFLALRSGVVKHQWVEPSGRHLRSLLPLLFVAPSVSILEHWGLLRANALSILLILLLSTFVTFAVSGKVTDILVKKGEE